MKLHLSRMSTVWILAAGLLLTSGTPASRPAVLQPNKLVILSTTDVKGKTIPCGCHVPKGGLSRRAAFADSLRAAYGQVLLLDNGAFFPEDEVHRDAAWFLMDAMKSLGTDAVNVSDKDLLFGRAFLEQRARKAGLTMVSANLLDKKSRRPVFNPYVIKQVGAVKVGVFGLITDKGDLGPGKDSLSVEEPLLAARKVVIELKRLGADVIVLMSQLGKAEGEDLVTAVDGIDAAIMGRNVLLIQKGRMLKSTIGCYGGEQGHYLCKTELTLDARHHIQSSEAEAVMLGPDVREKPEVFALTKTFEDALATRIEKARRQEEATNTVSSADDSPTHYVGAELCMRCHVKEGEAWKMTSHAQAFATLVNLKQESAEGCASCHASGYLKPGGFVSGAATPKMSNVQCESCHGMGTEHEAFSAAPARIDASTCTQCHTPKGDAHFNFETALPRIVHTNLSGETLKNKKLKQPADAKNVAEMLKTHGS